MQRNVAQNAIWTYTNGYDIAATAKQYGVPEWWLNIVDTLSINISDDFDFGGVMDDYVASATTWQYLAAGVAAAIPRYVDITALRHTFNIFLLEDHKARIESTAILSPLQNTRTVAALDECIALQTRALNGDMPSHDEWCAALDNATLADDTAWMSLRTGGPDTTDGSYTVIEAAIEACKLSAEAYRNHKAEEAMIWTCVKARGWVEADFDYYGLEFMRISYEVKLELEEDE